MAYQVSIGTATRTVFLTDLIAFAVANAGFTNEGTTVDGSDTIYHLSKTTDAVKIYWNFVLHDWTYTDTEWVVRSKMSYSKILTYAEIDGTGDTGDYQYYATEMTFFKNSGPYVQTYLFTDGVAVHAVTEVYTNVFAMMSFGNLEKYGTWNGGEFLQATTTYRLNSATYNSWDNTRTAVIFNGGIGTTTYNYRGNYVRNCPISQLNTGDDFSLTGQTTQYDQRNEMVVGSNGTSTSRSFVYDLIINGSPITFNQRAPLFPIYVRILNPATSRFELKGIINYARVLNISVLAPGTIVENDWMVFPIIQKSDGDLALAPVGDVWGLAYKKDA